MQQVGIQAQKIEWNTTHKPCAKETCIRKMKTYKAKHTMFFMHCCALPYWHLCLSLSKPHQKWHRNTFIGRSNLNQNEIHLQQVGIQTQNIKWKHNTQTLCQRNLHEKNMKTYKTKHIMFWNLKLSKVFENPHLKILSQRPNIPNHFRIWINFELKKI